MKLAISLWTCISHLDYRLHLLCLPLLLRTHIKTGLITGMSIACLGMVLTHTTFMIRTKLTKLHISSISLHSASSVLVLLSIFRICFLPLGYLLLGHLLSGSIPNHLMHSKDAECTLMFLSAMPRGVSVAHIYVLNPPLHHL